MNHDIFRPDDTRWIELGVLDEDPKVIDLDGYDNCSRYAGVVLSGDEYAQCRVANIGASSLRGLFFAPKKGDQVLVLFPGGRENAGIILGGLNSDATPIPQEVDTDEVNLINAGGIHLQTETGQGNVGAGNIGLTAPSGNVTVTADRASGITLRKSVGSSPSPLVKESQVEDIEAVFDGIELALKAIGLTAGPALATFKARVLSGFYLTDTVEAD